PQVAYDLNGCQHLGYKERWPLINAQKILLRKCFQTLIQYFPVLNAIGDSDIRIISKLSSVAVP
ncbi:MAG: hypothetical protein ACI8Y3_001658, partial [Paraglaciecola sp.]